jgi:Protein of unknown function (DUF4876)
MKNRIKLLAICSMIVLSSCDSIVNTVEKPSVSERQEVFNIKFVDDTHTLEKVYGDNLVRNASILLRSNTLNKEYLFVSDENGMISIGDIISDKYLIASSRIITAEEMEIATGEKKYNQKLVNYSTGVVELRADRKDTITIAMDKLLIESSLVISEIYACGPPEAGLYFHDKYVEIFNQSDEIEYLDGMQVAVIYKHGPTGFSYVDDPNYIHTKTLWKFPGGGNDYPILPGQFVVCAEDAIDHRINAEKSIDLSHVSFEFYKDDAFDVDNPEVPNMEEIYQPSGYDWLIGGETGALIISNAPTDSIIWFNDHYIIPNKFVLDGAEYLPDVTRIDRKILFPGIDAGATGGIQFYTGKTMERIPFTENGKIHLKDDNNSSIDFKVYNEPSPEYHNEIE